MSKKTCRKCGRKFEPMGYKGQREHTYCSPCRKPHSKYPIGDGDYTGHSSQYGGPSMSGDK